MQILLRWILLVAPCLLLSLPIQAQDAVEIVRQMDEKRRGESAIATMTISIVRPSWSRDMTVKSWSKGTDFSLILITEPARDKGTVFLKREKDLWNWIPSIERNIKMPPSMLMQSWMGSDFTNDDLIQESSIVEDYVHQMVGDSTIDGREAFKIELIPKPDAPVVWGKLLLWVGKEELIELRTEMYDEDGYLVSAVSFSEIQDLGGRMLPAVMEYVPADKPDHRTILRYHAIDFEDQIPDSFFSLRNMRRVQ